MSLWPPQRTPDPATDAWSIPVGSVMASSVRIHLSLAMVGVVAAWWSVRTAAPEALAAFALLVASVLLHEAAHALAAWRVGGRVEGIVLSPVGGLRPARLPDDPESRLFVAMAGPLANLAAVVVGASCLAAFDEPSLAALFVPRIDALVSGELLSSPHPAASFAKLLVWVNWPLFVLNLLPASPFDGGRTLAAMAAPWLGGRGGTVAAGWLGSVVGVLMMALALMLDGQERAEPPITPPIELTLLALGMLVAYGGRRDAQRASLGEDLLPGRFDAARPAAPADPNEGDWWSDPEGQMVLVESRSARAEQQEPAAAPNDSDDATEETRLDDVLARLHELGPSGLSAEDRAVLDRASRRLRRRRGQD